MSIFSEKYKEGLPNIITTRVDKDIMNYINENKVEPFMHKLKLVMFEKTQVFIMEHILVIIFLFGIIIFLTYRYIMKKKKENYSQYDDDTYDIMQFHKKTFARPTMNPYYPLKKQMNYAVYLPDKLRKKNINYDKNNQKIFSSRDLKEVAIPSQIHKYTYPNYGAYQSTGTYYSGLSDTYSKNNNLTNIENPLGYPTNFNETTKDFISSVTGLNKQTISTYYDILQNNNNILEQNLNVR